MEEKAFMEGFNQANKSDIVLESTAAPRLHACCKNIPVQISLALMLRCLLFY